MGAAAMAKAREHEEKEELSLSKAAEYLLEECRMVLPGIQALFGFQLIALFNQGFGEKLSHAQQLLHLVAIILTTLAMALVMTPAALLAAVLVTVFIFLWLVVPRRERR